MKFAVVVFPGSNCDHDAYHAAKHVLGQDAEFVWHKDTSLKGADVVILPGGFSHGDYLRTGAIARFSPIMARGPRVRARGAARCSASATASRCCSRRACCPGAMLRNRDLKFHCEQVCVRVEQTDTPFTQRASRGQVLQLPIAHGEGNYFAEPDVIERARVDRPGRLPLLRRAGDGHATPPTRTARVNNIAGICNEARNVVGLMPHPERACEAALGSADGLVLFESVVSALAGQGAAPELRDIRPV